MCCGQDNESDGDYESAGQEEGDDGYICTMTESQRAEDYELPAYAATSRSPQRTREAKITDSFSRGNKKPLSHQCCAGGTAMSLESRIGVNVS